ncbi:hypothetical protein [Pantoea eucrina]|uniref:hypothetical protein n=1 Tax=Pantoea eucrina TaxID=472693 RepID=UPI002FDB3F9D
MISTWGTVCVGLISSLSALVACWMANKAAETRLDKQLELERQREWQKARIAKAEEIYAALIKFDSMIFSTHMQWISFARGETTIEKLIEKINDQPENDAAAMRARLGIYFPDLLENFVEVKALTKPANQCYFSLTSGKEFSSDERKEFIRVIFSSNEAFSKGIAALLKRLSEQVSSV